MAETVMLQEDLTRFSIEHLLALAEEGHATWGDQADALPADVEEDTVVLLASQERQRLNRISAELWRRGEAGRSRLAPIFRLRSQVVSWHQAFQTGANHG